MHICGDFFEEAVRMEHSKIINVSGSVLKVCAAANSVNTERRSELAIQAGAETNGDVTRQRIDRAHFRRNGPFGKSRWKFSTLSDMRCATTIVATGSKCHRTCRRNTWIDFHSLSRVRVRRMCSRSPWRFFSSWLFSVLALYISRSRQYLSEWRAAPTRPRCRSSDSLGSCHSSP